MRTASQAELGSAAAEVTIRMSLISGRLRKEESQKATRNMPGEPRSGTSTVCIQRTILCTLPCSGRQVAAAIAAHSRGGLDRLGAEGTHAGRARFGFGRRG